MATQVGFVTSFAGFSPRSSSRVSVLREGHRRSRYTFQHARQNGRCRMNASGSDSLADAPPPAPDAQQMSVSARELRSLLRKCPLYFVGCMGSGKSSVAKYVAYELGFRFLDTDELVELVAGRSVSKIFEEDGAEAFHDLESAILNQVQSYVSTCIATGGAIVLRNENWAVLQTGIVVWLDAPPSVLAKRLDGDSSRPRLAGMETVEEKEEALSAILEARRTKYALADVVVPVTAEKAVDNIALDLMRRVSNFIKENPPKLSQKGKELFPEDTPRPPAPEAGA